MYYEELDEMVFIETNHCWIDHTDCVYHETVKDSEEEDEVHFI